mmetsp:Transcript_45246/g.107687  ORF Transcript_45246/g.107687 Transcript_45246/m.107687 type:complete len:219 (+) Transcript_45246:106-762(+)
MPGLDHANHSKASPANYPDQAQVREGHASVLQGHSILEIFADVAMHDLLKHLHSNLPDLTVLLACDSSRSRLPLEQRTLSEVVVLAQCADSVSVLLDNHGSTPDDAKLTTLISLSKNLLAGWQNLDLDGLSQFRQLGVGKCPEDVYLHEHAHLALLPEDHVKALQGHHCIDILRTPDCDLGKRHSGGGSHSVWPCAPFCIVLQHELIPNRVVPEGPVQ